MKRKSNLFHTLICLLWLLLGSALCLSLTACGTTGPQLSLDRAAGICAVQQDKAGNSYAICYDPRGGRYTVKVNRTGQAYALTYDPASKAWYGNVQGIPVTWADGKLTFLDPVEGVK